MDSIFHVAPPIYVLRYGLIDYSIFLSPHCVQFHMVRSGLIPRSSILLMMGVGFAVSARLLGSC